MKYDCMKKKKEEKNRRMRKWLWNSCTKLKKFYFIEGFPTLMPMMMLSKYLIYFQCLCWKWRHLMRPHHISFFCFFSSIVIYIIVRSLQEKKNKSIDNHSLVLLRSYISWNNSTDSKYLWRVLSPRGTTKQGNSIQLFGLHIFTNEITSKAVFDF